MIRQHEWLDWQTQSPGHAAAAAFLLLDVQSNISLLETLQVALDKLKTNPTADTYAMSGNSYFIQMQPQYVLIEELYGDDYAEPVTLSLEDFAAALAYWRTRLTFDHSE